MNLLIPFFVVAWTEEENKQGHMSDVDFSYEKDGLGTTWTIHDLRFFISLVAMIFLGQCFAFNPFHVILLDVLLSYPHLLFLGF